MNTRSCAQVLEMLLQEGDAGRIPWVLLRPRDFDEVSVFEGDFDFLVDARRVEEILDTVFRICREAGVSFIVRQQSAFKRQIELLDTETEPPRDERPSEDRDHARDKSGNRPPDGRRVTLELWPHAEFRLRASHSHLTRAALDYAAYEAAPADERPSLLAAIFILHLHHKDKDPQAGLVQTRLRHFADQPGLAPALHAALVALREGTEDPRQSHAQALDYLRARHLPLKSPWRLVAERAGWSLRNLLRWPAPRTAALVGPDGSGKTALMNAARDLPTGRRLRHRKFKRVFRRPLFHLLKREPRNVRDEKMLWLILPVAWVCFSVSRWLTGWARPVLYDRYFYDYFVRDMRDPHRALSRIGAYDLCTALAPRPRRLVVATCPTEVIHQRKMEMSQASIERLYGVYIDQVARAGIPETLFCHTGVALRTSSAQMAAFLDR